MIDSFFEHKFHAISDKINPAAKSDKLVWEKWRKLINMTVDEIAEFNSKSDESLETLIKMLAYDNFEKAEAAWTSHMWKLCRKQTSSILKNRGMRKRLIGNPFEKDGKKTRWLKTCLMSGYDPRKKLTEI